MALRLPEPDKPSRAPWAVPVVVGLVAAALALWKATSPAPPDQDPEGAELAGSASASAREAPKPPVLPRCTEVAEPFVVGEPPKPKPAAEDGGEPGEEPEDLISPFAVEVGRGTVFSGGFAAGVRRDEKTGAIAMVATIGADGKNGQLVKLARSRGDFDAPVVTGAGASVLAVMLEPNAGGRAIKVAKVTGAEVAWGAEFSEGRDDSLAVDIAASGERAVVVWDDLTGQPGALRSNVMLASFDVATMKSVAPARPISAKDKDATNPHLVVRPGGYWLAYLAHAPEDEQKRKKKPKEGRVDVDESDEQGESITAAWVEIVPLDENGAPAGGARAVSPKNGHALSFDLEPGEGGGALIAWRDDDTPTGSSGGRVSVALVKLSGGGDPRVLLDEAGGAGAPDLLPGWISLASMNGATRLGALTPAGELVDEIAPEPSLGAGEPIAATAAAILWARPAGQAMRLSVVRCRPREKADGGT
jgi:hypothetical protein